MKSKTVPGVALIILAGIVCGTFRIQFVDAAGTIYIRADGSVDPPTPLISNVGNATYTFTDNINQSIIVQRNNVTLDGKGYTVQGPRTTSSVGITVQQAGGITLTNMTITGFDFGIMLYSSSNNNITKTNITTNYYYGIWLDSFSNRNSISRNNVTHNEHGIRLESSTDNIITANNITANNQYGVWLYDSADNRICANSIRSNEYGIRIDSSANTDIAGNDITSNFLGVEINSSPTNRVAENNITSNVSFGMLLYSSSGTGMTRNNMTANGYYGIRLEQSSNNNITANYITRNDYGGIWLMASSANRVHHNNFINNAGPELSDLANVWDDGYPSGGNYWNSYNGTDQKNGQAQDMQGCDGIGDTPYSINQNNRDRYPLMGPFNSFEAGTWGNVTYNVDMVSNSTLSDFLFIPTDASLLFTVTGNERTLGFCRLTIPKNLLSAINDEWIIHVDSLQITNFTLAKDQEHTYIYFTYDLSNRTITIQGTTAIPEFPKAFAILLLAIGVLLTAMVCRKRLKPQPQNTIRPLPK